MPRDYKHRAQKKKAKKPLPGWLWLITGLLLACLFLLLEGSPWTSYLLVSGVFVGVATTALGLALIVRIKEAYGTVEEDEIHEQDERS